MGKPRVECTRIAEDTNREKYKDLKKLGQSAEAWIAKTN